MSRSQFYLLICLWHTVFVVDSRDCFFSLMFKKNFAQCLWSTNRKVQNKHHSKAAAVDDYKQHNILTFLYGHFIVENIPI